MEHARKIVIAMALGKGINNDHEDFVPRLHL